MTNEKWLFIGTDARLAACKLMMEEEGKICRLVKTDVYSADLKKTLLEFQADYIVFPILQMKDSIPIEMLQHQPKLYTGVTTSEWLSPFEQAGLVSESYLKEDMFVWENARMTAEAFSKEFYQHTNEVIYGKIFYVAGFGRVGKMVAHMLQKIGGEVTVIARASDQLAEAKMLGFQICPLDAPLDFSSGYLVNTIPVKWLDIGKLPPRFIFDLASAPGCLVEQKSIEYYTLLPGLPGKHFPVDAASALKDALNRMTQR